MEKNIIVRFSWQHDPDLIILFHDPRFQGRQAKCSKHNPHPQSNPRNAFIKKFYLHIYMGRMLRFRLPCCPQRRSPLQIMPFIFLLISKMKKINKSMHF